MSARLKRMAAALYKVACEEAAKNNQGTTHAALCCLTALRDASDGQSAGAFAVFNRAVLGGLPMVPCDNLRPHTNTYTCLLCGQRIEDGKPCGCGARKAQ